MVRVIISQQCYYCVARVIAVASASGRVVGDVMVRVIILQQCHNCVARVIAVASVGVRVVVIRVVIIL